jgi:transcriptional regulator with XRE-family HTH domain
MDIREVFALNLRRARNAKGLPQEALAHEADVDRTYVSALERSVLQRNDRHGRQACEGLRR